MSRSLLTWIVALFVFTLGTLPATAAVPKPALTTITPTQAVVGTMATVRGVNLDRGSNGQIWSGTPSYAIQFRSGTGWVTTPKLVYVSSTKIRVKVPDTATTGQLRLIQGRYRRLTPGTFTVLPRPEITTFMPSQAPVGGTVVLNGQDLNRGARGSIWSGTPPYKIQFTAGTGFVDSVFTVQSATAISAVVPAGATSGKIRLIQGAYRRLTPTAFTVGPAETLRPVVTSFTPTSGGVGSQVVLTGARLDRGADGQLWSGTPPYSIQFAAATGFAGATGSVNALFTYESPTRLTAIVPNGAATGAIRLVQGGYANVAAGTFAVTAAPQKHPTLASFSPSSGAVGTEVVLTGADLNYGAKGAVWIGSPPDTIQFAGASGFINAAFTYSSATQLRAIVPSGAITGAIRLAEGSYASLAVGTFTVTVVPTRVPVLASFSPTSGVAGTRVIVTGADFDRGAGGSTWSGTPPYRIEFAGPPGPLTAVFQYSTPMRLDVTVPAAATTGPIRLVQGSYASQTPGTFTVLPRPVLTGLNPTSGAIGTEVTITGADLDRGANGAVWAGTPPYIIQFQSGAGFVNATFTRQSATQLRAVVPPGTTTGAVRLSERGYTSTAPAAFTVLPQPAITGLNPTSGVRRDRVNIQGTNFNRGFSGQIWTGTATYQLEFPSGQGFVPATFTYVSSTELTATVPEGAVTGAPRLSEGTWTQVSPVAFTVLPTPELVGFSPNSGTIGSSVVITGTDLNRTPFGELWSGTPPYQVQFSGASGFITATFSVNSATQITAAVPTGAVTGVLRLYKSYFPIPGVPTFVRTTQDPFTVTNPPPTATKFRLQNSSQFALVAIRFNNASRLLPGEFVPAGNYVEWTVSPGTISRVETELGVVNEFGLLETWFNTAFNNVTITANQITTRTVPRITATQVLTDFQSQATFLGTYWVDLRPYTARFVFSSGGTWKFFDQNVSRGSGNVIEVSWPNYSSMVTFRFFPGGTNVYFLAPWGLFWYPNGPQQSAIEYIRQY